MSHLLLLSNGFNPEAPPPETTQPDFQNHHKKPASLIGASNRWCGDMNCVAFACAVQWFQSLSPAAKDHATGFLHMHDSAQNNHTKPASLITMN